VGGLILVAGANAEDLERRLALDPFGRLGLAEHTVVDLNPTRDPPQKHPQLNPRTARVRRSWVSTGVLAADLSSAGADRGLVRGSVTGYRCLSGWPASTVTMGNRELILRSSTKTKEP
jgi:hypothetical protein